MSASEVIAIRASLGGLNALSTVLSGLPASLGCSVLVVQHRRPDQHSILRALLAKSCKLPVVEPEDKAPLELNHVYLAPADYHMLVDRRVISLSVDAPVNHARPSIDVLFESLADSYGKHSVAVMLTSSNDDGARGAQSIKRAGGKVIVQDPTTAENGTGPRAVLARSTVDAVLKLEEIAAMLSSWCGAAAQCLAH